VAIVGRLLELRSPVDWQVLIGAGTVLGFALVRLALSIDACEWVTVCCWMLVPGYVGMLGGLMLDTEGSGFMQLLAQCRIDRKAGFDSILSSFSNMPIAYIAMIAGCHGGIWARQKLSSFSGAVPPPRPCFLAINLGMTAGMALGHWVATAFAADLPIRAYGANLLLWMLVGMSSGLVASYRTRVRECVPPGRSPVVFLGKGMGHGARRSHAVAKE
jgi:hypothetical protein